MAKSDHKKIVDRILERKVPFLVTFFFVFLITYAILFAIDFYPELVLPSQETRSEEEQSNEETNIHNENAAQASASAIATTVEPEAATKTYAELPQEIYIERLDKTIEVLNPTSRKIADLDAALLEGVVRHPDSATFSKEGNIFILGHSSYLPNVFNRNFQAFNEIQTLRWGDLIVVRSADNEYTYRVDDVYKAKASEVTVPIADTGPKLTLATCDSFGSTDDRYILEASLVGKKEL